MCKVEMTFDRLSMKFNSRFLYLKIGENIGKINIYDEIYVLFEKEECLFSGYLLYFKVF